jgi:Gas vesicle synthesis protein GvpL/GvpF
MQDEEFLRRLSEVLRSTDEPGVEPIVARAREAAVQEATTILEALITRAILERAVDHLSPRERDVSPAPCTTPGAEPQWLWYVYGIQRVDADPPTEMTGIVGAPVDYVEADGLRAIVSKVRSTDFGQPALVDHFDDLEWVGTNAQAHETVLGAALAAGSVLPLRFGTVFRDREAVVEVLRRHDDELLAELDRMTGRREWGAKVLVDIDTCDRWMTEHTPGLPQAATDPATRGGRAYLARRQAQRGTRDERHRLLLQISSEIHERLSELAVDSTTDPPQQRQLSGHEGEMILNGAYLVDDTAVERLREAAGELTERHSDKGVVVQITGPWPPHHFISLPPLGDLGEPA